MERERATRLRQARIAAGFKSARQAASSFRWKAPTYGSHENGHRDFNLDDAKRYAKAFKVDPLWLYAGESSDTEPERIMIPAVRAPGIVEVAGVEFTQIGRFDASFSAGPGSLLEPTPEPLGFHLLERQWLNAITTAAPEYLAVVRVAGDSMQDTLQDGDWVLVDRRQQRFSREGLYALHVGDDAWIKRVSINMRERLIRIISDNPRYPLQELPEDDVQLIGRVVSLVARRFA